MKLKKIKLISIIMIMLCLSYIATIKIYSLVYFPEEKLKQQINHFLRLNTQKAIFFKKVNISLLGNIHIYDFDISAGSDFNDNRNKIYIPETILDVNIFAFLNHRPFIKSVELINPDIRFVKQYGKNYLYKLKNIFDIEETIKIIKLYSSNDQFEIIFKNASLVYQEKYKTDDLNVKFNYINSLILIESKNIDLKINSKIVPYKTKFIKDSKLNIIAKIILDENNKIKSKDIKLNFKNFDLSYLNLFIKEKMNLNYLLQGGYSSNLKIVNYKNYFDLIGTVDVNSLGVARVFKNNNYLIFSNENFSFKFNSEISDNLNSIMIKRFQVKDENINFTGKFSYNKNKLKKYYELEFRGDEINLNNLSNYFTPIKGIHYGGALNLNGIIKYDLKRSFADKIDIESSLSDFFAYKIVNGKRDNYFHNFDGALLFKNNLLDVNFYAKREIGDISFSSNTSINSWKPLASETVLRLNSKIVEFDFATRIAKNLLFRLYDIVYKDLKKGDNQIFFRDKAIGKLIINNDIDFDYKIDNIRFGERSNLKGFNLSLKLKNGNFTTESFSLNGYDAQYNFNAEARFNRDNPTGKIKFSLANLNLSNFYNDYGLDGVKSGLFNFNLDYDANGYRAQHLVNYAKAQIDINIKDLQLINTSFQKRFISIIDKDDSPLNEIFIKNINFNFKETAYNFYIRNFSVQGDLLNFSSRGRYSYYDGLNAPIYMNIIDFKDNKKISQNYRFYLKGNLTNPYLLYKGNKEKKLFLF